MKEKKGIKLSQAFGAVLTLVLVAVLVVIAIVIFVSLSGTFAGTIPAATVINETLIPTTNGTAVDNASRCEFGDFAVSLVLNRSTGDVIDSGNYTVGSAGTIANISNEYSADQWNVTYSFTWGSDACTASDNMTTEFGNYPALVGLVGTIIFLGLVIGVLVASFAFGGRREV